MTDRILKLKDAAVIRYNQRETIATIAFALHINIKTVRKLLRNADVEIRGSKKNLIDQPFGRLVVIRYVGVDKFQKCLWECDCICGNKTIVRGSDLISKKVESCGCYRSETSRENIKISHKKYPKSYGFKGIGDITGGYLSQIKHGAFTRNLEYSISKEYLWGLYIKQNRKCALTGLDIYFGLFGGGKRWGKRDQTASLDRIDSKQGYVEGNVWWVHKDINNIKQDYSLFEFLGYCKMVTDYEKEKHTL